LSHRRSFVRKRCLRPAIVARPAIVPRSLDWGISIQVFEMNRFPILA
jgi:hypothetical protein